MPADARRHLQVGRKKGIPGEDVLDVHEQQLLMLLLMMESQGDQLRKPRLTGISEQGLHCAVDVGPIARDLLDARTREEAALGPRMARTHGLVVRVEDEGVRIVERAVAVGVLPEDERLEEPRHVRPMPLRRTHVGHRLDGLILAAQDRRQPLGGGTNPGVGLQQVGRRFSTGCLHRLRPFAILAERLHTLAVRLRITLPRCGSDLARLPHFSRAGRKPWWRGQIGVPAGPNSAVRSLGTGDAAGWRGEVEPRRRAGGTSLCSRPDRPFRGAGIPVAPVGLVAPARRRTRDQASTLPRKLRSPRAKKMTLNAAMAG